MHFVFDRPPPVPKEWSDVVRVDEEVHDAHILLNQELTGLLADCILHEEEYLLRFFANKPSIYFYVRPGTFRSIPRRRRCEMAYVSIVTDEV